MALDKLLDVGNLTVNGAAWGLTLAAALFVGSLVLVAVLVVQIPAGYFRDEELDRPSATWHPALRWTWLIVKNVLGVGLVVAGVIMLLTPGQGILTLLVGLMLMDIPGKRRLERSLVRRKHVLDALNKLRSRFGKPPLVV
ncbi:MAG: hypothetical protein ACT4QC_09825 [Planctomycetaceae bacterium]